MTEDQNTALRCAYADLLGSYQAYQQQDQHVHDWDAHRLSIEDLEREFPELVKPYDHDNREDSTTDAI